jgi:hypothetical protein
MCTSFCLDVSCEPFLEEETQITSVRNQSAEKCIWIYATEKRESRQFRIMHNEKFCDFLGLYAT